MKRAGFSGYDGQFILLNAVVLSSCHGGAPYRVHVNECFGEWSGPRRGLVAVQGSHHEVMKHEWQFWGQGQVETPPFREWKRRKHKLHSAWRGVSRLADISQDSHSPVLSLCKWDAVSHGANLFQSFWIQPFAKRGSHLNAWRGSFALDWRKPLSLSDPKCSQFGALAV